MESLTNRWAIHAPTARHTPDAGSWYRRFSAHSLESQRERGRNPATLDDDGGDDQASLRHLLTVTRTPIAVVGQQEDGSAISRSEGWVFRIPHERTWERADSGSCPARPVTEARRAIPRRIHGVRLAISATARSERRIAVRGPGVGVDASSASGDPARGPWRSTARSCHVPGTPRSSTLPRS